MFDRFSIQSSARVRWPQILQSHLRADTAGAEETPAADGFEHAKEADDDERDAGPEGIVGEDNSNDEENGAGDAARDAALKADVSLKKSGHAAT